MDEVGKVATIIENHVKGLSVFECCEGLLNAPEILLFGFALPSVNRDTSCGNAGKKIELLESRKTDHHVRSSGMILSGEDILKRRWSGFWGLGRRIRLTQEDHVTSAPKTMSVSIRTAVWIVLSIRKMINAINQMRLANPTCEGIRQYAHPSRVAWRYTSKQINESRVGRQETDCG